jgi:hypothetical protein
MCTSRAVNITLRTMLRRVAGDAVYDARKPDAEREYTQACDLVRSIVGANGPNARGIRVDSFEQLLVVYRLSRAVMPHEVIRRLVHDGVVASSEHWYAKTGYRRSAAGLPFLMDADLLYDASRPEAALTYSLTLACDRNTDLNRRFGVMDETMRLFARGELDADAVRRISILLHPPALATAAVAPESPETPPPSNEDRCCRVLGTVTVRSAPTFDPYPL